MGRADGRVQPGQRLDTAFSARAWNRAQDAADIVLGDRGNVAAEPIQPPTAPWNVVRARFTANANQADDGEDATWKVGHFHVLGGFVLNKPASDSEAWTGNPVFSPPPGLYGDTLAIALEPIPIDGIGRVAIAGVCPAKLNLRKFHWRYAVPWIQDFSETNAELPNQYNSSNVGNWRLQTFPFAGYKVLWHEKSSTDSYPQNNVWGLIDLSSWWAQPIVLAKSVTGLQYNQQDPFGDPGGYGELGLCQLYVTHYEPTGIYVRVQNTHSPIQGDKWVWLLNPFSLHRHSIGVEYFTQTDLDVGTVNGQFWTVIGTENRPVFLQTVAINGVQRGVVGSPDEVPPNIYLPGGQFD